MLVGQHLIDLAHPVFPRRLDFLRDQAVAEEKLLLASPQSCEFFLLAVSAWLAPLLLLLPLNLRAFAVEFGESTAPISKRRPRLAVPGERFSPMLRRNVQRCGSCLLLDRVM